MLKKKIFFYLFCIFNQIDFYSFIFTKNKTGINNYKHKHIASNRLSFNRIYSLLLFFIHVIPWSIFIILLLIKQIRSSFISKDLFLIQSILMAIIMPVASYGKLRYGFRDNDKSYALTTENRIITTYYVTTFYIPLLYKHLYSKIINKWFYIYDVVVLIMLYSKYKYEKGNFRLFIGDRLFMMVSFLKANQLILKKKDSKILSYMVVLVFFNTLTMNIPYLNNIISLLTYGKYIKS